ncbi:MAG: formimidoylglutamate deiminase [Polyangiales bacterium]
MLPPLMRLPAFATAHSHAFQRGLRGRAQRPRPGTGVAREDFWSWRGAMYDLATSLDPTSLAAISDVAFRELAAAGVRTVGEFHYVHHQPDGTPYDDRTLLSQVVIESARRAGLRIALLRVAYARAGPGLPPEAAQRRFCDPQVDDVLRDVETLRAKYRDDAAVRIGIAPHSVRAVPREWLRPLADAARALDVPLHMHVAEQPAEIEACLAETGRRPVELLADEAVLHRKFVAVHATHLAPHEAKLLGDAASFACICPTTERDLGDGLPDLAALRAARVRLCVGVDSHAICDPLEEIRALETGERLRTLRRNTLSPEQGTPAEQLWREGSTNGALACGFDDDDGLTEAEVTIDETEPSLALVPRELLLDAVVFGAPGRVVRRAW